MPFRSAKDDKGTPRASTPATLNCNPLLNHAQISEKSAWFKNARFRVTRGASARALIGPALKWVYERESLVAVPGLISDN